jgi:hypothetical protein
VGFIIWMHISLKTSCQCSDTFSKTFHENLPWPLVNGPITSPYPDHSIRFQMASDSQLWLSLFKHFIWFLQTLAVYITIANTFQAFSIHQALLKITFLNFTFLIWGLKIILHHKLSIYCLCTFNNMNFILNMWQTECRAPAMQGLKIKIENT